LNHRHDCHHINHHLHNEGGDDDDDNEEDEEEEEEDDNDNDNENVNRGLRCFSSPRCVFLKLFLNSTNDY
jgi:hypothetical protein